MYKETNMKEMPDHEQAGLNKIAKIMTDLGIQSITTTDKTTVIIQDGDVIVVKA